MKKLFLICLILCFLAMKCLDEDTIKCSDCYDREAVLKEVNRIAVKRLGNIDNYKIRVEEEVDFYTINYSLNVPSMFGGGIFIKISKKDCEIIDYKRFK